MNRRLSNSIKSYNLAGLVIQVITALLFSLPVMGKIDVNGLTKRAEAGDVAAAVALGEAYYRGTGVVKDRGKACALFEGAVKESEEARAWLGQSYMLGRGVARDPGKAVAIFQMLVNDEEPLGFQHLGASYLDGWGVPKDEKKGAELALKAAEMDDYVAQRTTMKAIKLTANPSTIPTAPQPPEPLAPVPFSSPATVAATALRSPAASPSTTP